MDLMAQMVPLASKFPDSKIRRVWGQSSLWEDHQESFLEEVVRLERRLRDSKEEEHGPLCQPAIEVLSRTGAGEGGRQKQEVSRAGGWGRRQRLGGPQELGSPRMSVGGRRGHKPMPQSVNCFDIFTACYFLSSPALFKSCSTPDPPLGPVLSASSQYFIDPRQAFGGRGHPRLGPERGSVAEVAGWGLSPEPQLVAATLILKIGHWVPWELGAGHGSRELASSAMGGGCWAPSQQERLGQGWDSRILCFLATHVTQWAGKRGRRAGSQHRGALRRVSQPLTLGYCPAWGGAEPQLPK